MIDVEIEPHTNRIGGDNVIDLARLEHGHLFVARFGAECAHDDSRAPAKAPQHFGNRIDLL